MRRQFGLWMPDESIEGECKFPLGVMAYHVSVFHLVVGSCLLKIKPLGWLLKEERKKESEDSADFHVAKPIEN